MEHFEYTTITITITGAKSGFISYFQRKGVDEESFNQLERMGRNGWDLIAVIPVSHGAVGAQATDAAICFLKRTKTQKPQPSRDTNLCTSPEISTTSNDSITSQQLDVLVARDRMRKECLESGYWMKMTASDWDFITSNRAPEALPAIEQRITSLTLEDDSEMLRARLLAFYSLLRREEAAESLYKLAEQPKSFSSAKQITKIITTLGIFSVSKITKLLQSTDRDTRLNALHLLWSPKAQYSSSDAVEYQQLADAVVKAFPLADAFERKGLLGKIKKNWNCFNCKSEVENSSDVCQCGCDRYGVTAEHQGMRVVLERLERQRLILQSAQFDL